MARINDLERGFEKTLAYAYGKHVVQGHLIMHNVDIVGTEKQVTLLMALGDGAYDEDGHGAWGICSGGSVEGCDLTSNAIFEADAADLDAAYNDNDQILTFTETSPHAYVMNPSRALTGDWDMQTFQTGVFGSEPSIQGFTEPLDCSSTTRNAGFTHTSTNSNLFLPGAFTMVMVVKLAQFDGCWQNGVPTLMTRRGTDAGGDLTGWELYAAKNTSDPGATGEFIFHRWNSSMTNICVLQSGDNSVIEGTKYIITIVCDGSTVRMRINGTEVDSDTYATSTAPAASDFHFLNSGNGQNAPQGETPFTKIWSRQFTSDELNSLEYSLGQRYGIAVAATSDPCVGGTNWVDWDFNVGCTEGSNGAIDDTAPFTWGAGGPGSYATSTPNALTAPGDYLEFKVSSPGCGFYVGIHDDATPDFSTDSDQVAYFDFGTSLSLPVCWARDINGSGSSAISYDGDDVFRITRTATTFEFRINGVLEFTITPGAMSGTLYPCFESGNNVDAPGETPGIFDVFTGSTGSSAPSTFCPGVQAVYYAGRLIDSSNWHYHPGTFSTGADDPIQGIDSFFPGGITYSATAYIAIRLPVGVADEADPSKLAIILETSCIADYDAGGNVTEISYSANPARVKADMLRRRGQHVRINWDSYIQARNWYDEMLDWESGDTADTYTDVTQTPTYKLSGNIQVAAGGALTKTNTAIDTFDNVATTEELIVYGEDGYFQATLGGSFPTFTGGGEMHLVDSTGKAIFGIAWGNGHFGIFANNVGIDDTTIPYEYPAVAGDVIKLEVDAGDFVLRQNGVVKAIPHGPSPVPLDTNLYGRIRLYEGTAAITASSIQGQEVVTSTLTTTEVPRFEAHPAFTSPVQLADALDFVDSLCASDTQDAGAEIIFLTPATPAPRTSVFTFTEGENVVEGSLRAYKRDIRERPNRLSAVFRDLDTVYLEENEVFESRDELFDQLGYIIDPGALNFASMSNSQAQRLLKFQMRRMSDRDLFCDLRGMQDSFKLLPGDIVTVISEKLPGGVAEPKDFIILQCSRDSGESGAYQRSFTLQEWYASDYSDADHGPRQPALLDPVTSEGPSAPVLTLTQSV